MGAQAADRTPEQWRWSRHAYGRRFVDRDRQLIVLQFVVIDMEIGRDLAVSQGTYIVLVHAVASCLCTLWMTACSELELLHTTGCIIILVTADSLASFAGCSYASHRE